MEQWKAIQDYDGMYEISNQGTIKSFKRYKEGKILKPNLVKGYFYIILSKNAKPKTHKIHRLVAKEFVPNLKGYIQVNHIDGNKLNNLNTNLEWCTCSQNHKHAYKIGLKDFKGEKHPRAKLTYIQVEKIRELLQTKNMKQKEIAHIYGVSPMTISDIKRNKKWVE